MKKEYSKKQILNTISYWKSILNESYGKAELNLRGNPKNRDFSDIEDTDEINYSEKDIEQFKDGKNPFEAFSDYMLDAAERNGYANTWFVSNSMKRMYSTDPNDHMPTYPLAKLEMFSKEQFLDSCYDNCLAECHDVVYKSEVLVGPHFEIENIKGWSQSAHETFVSFSPDFNSNVITLVAIIYGSYDGGTYLVDFPSKDSLKTLLDDIYRMMPYLKQYETSNPKNILFKLPSNMMQEMHDRYERRVYAWKWSEDMQHKEQIKKDLIDLMWDERNIHNKNKEKEIEKMYKMSDEMPLDGILNESNEDDNVFFFKPVQKTINKLISEEWLAGNTYKLFLNAVKKEDKDKIQEAMFDAANDEIYDHMKSLVSVACKYDYDVPTSYKEFTKHAAKEEVKLFEDIKKKQDAIYYIKKAIEAEERAIKSYEEALELNELILLPELLIVLKNNYYDEKEHLETFKFIQYTLDSQMDM